MAFLYKYSLFPLQVDFLFACGYKAKEQKIFGRDIVKIPYIPKFDNASFSFFSPYPISLFFLEKEKHAYILIFFVWLVFLFFVCLGFWFVLGDFFLLDLCRWRSDVFSVFQKVFSSAKLLTYFGLNLGVSLDMIRCGTF